MVAVRPQPRLQLAALGRMKFAATVNKPLGNVADFGDVERNRHGLGTRQHEMERFFRMSLKQVSKLAKFHKVFFLIRRSNRG